MRRSVALVHSPCATITTIHTQKSSFCKTEALHLLNTSSPSPSPASPWQPPFSTTNVFEISGGQPGVQFKCWCQGVKARPGFCQNLNRQACVMDFRNSPFSPHPGRATLPLETPRGTGKTLERRDPKLQDLLRISTCHPAPACTN